MLKRNILLLFICLAALCLNAAPATADLFSFDVTGGGINAVVVAVPAPAAVVLGILGLSVVGVKLRKFA